MDGNSNIARAWMEYGRSYAKHRSLWDGSLAFASGPLQPEGDRLRDYSGRTAGAVWSVGAGDQPKYVQGTVKGQGFWAGSWDAGDEAIIFPATDGRTLTRDAVSVSTWIRRPSIGSTTRGRIVNELRYVSGSDTDGWFLEYAVDGTANKISIHAANDAVPVPDVSLINTSLEWFHLAGTIGGGIITLRINNGTPVTAAGGTRTPTAGRSSKIGATVLPFIRWQAATAVYSRVLTPNEIAALAIHPLEAYRVEVPRYWSFATAASGTHLWPWQIRRRRRMAGAR